MEATMEAARRICANCRVLVEPCPDGSQPPGQEPGWQHVPEFADRFDRSVCDRPAPGRPASGSEARYGLARIKKPSGDKRAIRQQITELDLPAGTPVEMAVDGSYKLTVAGRVYKPMSWGYLVTNGMWGLGTTIAPGTVIGGDVRADGSDEGRVLQAELRAIANGLGAIGERHPVTVLCDSKKALHFLALWQAGHVHVMPGGYDSRPRSGDHKPTLVRLAEQVHQGAGRIDWRWVRGHSGHPLNEGADTLSKMARAWATGQAERDAVLTQGRAVVLGALGRYANTCPA